MQLQYSLANFVLIIFLILYPRMEFRIEHFIHFTEVDSSPGTFHARKYQLFLLLFCPLLFQPRFTECKNSTASDYWLMIYGCLELLFANYQSIQEGYFIVVIITRIITMIAIDQKFKRKFPVFFCSLFLSCLSASVSARLSAFVSARLSASVSTYLSVSVSVYASACLSVGFCLSVRLFVFAFLPIFIASC